jgi:hypothetical protein
MVGCRVLDGMIEYDIKYHIVNNISEVMAYMGISIVPEDLFKM